MLLEVNIAAARIEREHPSALVAQLQELDLKQGLGFNEFLDLNIHAFPPESFFRARHHVLSTFPQQICGSLEAAREYLLALDSEEKGLPTECYFQAGEQRAYFTDVASGFADVLRNERWRIILGLEVDSIYHEIEPEEIEPEEETRKKITPNDLIKMVTDRIVRGLEQNHMLLTQHFKVHPVEEESAVSTQRQMLMARISQVVAVTKELQKTFSEIPAEFEAGREQIQLSEFLNDSAFLNALKIIAVDLPDESQLRNRLELVGNINHELRTPLTFIKGYLLILADEGVELPNSILYPIEEEGIVVNDFIDYILYFLNKIVGNRARFIIGGLGEIYRDIAPRDQARRETTPEELFDIIFHRIIDILAANKTRIEEHFRNHPVKPGIQEHSLNEVIVGLPRAIGTIKYLYGEFIGKYLIQPEEVDIHSVIELERRIAAFNQPETGLVLEVVNNSGLDRVYVDPSLLAIILKNLIQNLQKYGGARGEMTINQVTRNGQRFLEFALQDQGSGISSEDLPHIFERNYRVEKVVKQKEGMGYGLAISRKIVTAWGGEIWAESKGEGYGSTFSFTIPIEQELHRVGVNS